MNAIRRASALAPRVVGRSQSLRPGIGFDAVRAFAAGGASPPAAKITGLPEIHELGSIDNAHCTERTSAIAEPERRAFTYFALSGVRFAYASMARLMVLKAVSSISPSAEVLALAFSEFDLTDLEFGKSVTVKWRGKPIFIRRRTSEEIEEVRSVSMDHLRDQEADEERVANENFIVVVAICPHLGCVPVTEQGDYGAFFCPCHGSHYDLSGRIRKGPAPLNLEVPPYKFIDDQVILMG